MAWLVKPGDRVVVKPNLVKEGHPHRQDEWETIITHGSLIRAVVDYVLIALQGDGEVVIADSPQTDSNFDTIAARNGLYNILAFYQRYNMPVTLLDLREEQWYGANGVIQRRVPLSGDPKGYSLIDLGGDSAFASYEKNGLFYGAYYDTSDLAKFHSISANRHQYMLAKTIMDADVFINLI